MQPTSYLSQSCDIWMVNELTFSVFIRVGNKDIDYPSMLHLPPLQAFQCILPSGLQWTCSSALWGPTIQLTTNTRCQLCLRTPCVPLQILLASVLPPAAASVTSSMSVVIGSTQLPSHGASLHACPETFLLTLRHEIPWGPQSCLSFLTCVISVIILVLILYDYSEDWVI